MDDKQRCQSCGMPLGESGFYGTESDGTENQDYCKFCYQDGAYVLPDLTVEQMIRRSVDFMTSDLGFAQDQAQSMSESIIPHLKRWSK